MQCYTEFTGFANQGKSDCCELLSLEAPIVPVQSVQRVQAEITRLHALATILESAERR
jgi:hypothetical protein